MGQITWKESIEDFTSHFFKPKAPISYEMYNKQKLLTLPIAIVVLVVWLYHIVNKNTNTELFDKLSEAQQHQILVQDSLITALLLLSVIIVTNILTIPTEIRMFHKRGKSPFFYVVLSVVTLLGSLGYIFLTYSQNKQIETLPLFLLLWIGIFMSNNFYVKKMTQ